MTGPKPVALPLGYAPIAAADARLGAAHHIFRPLLPQCVCAPEIAADMRLAAGRTRGYNPSRFSKTECSAAW